MVFDHEDPPRDDLRRRTCFDHWWRCRLNPWCAFELENEGRAAILSLALYGKLPFVTLDERLRDGKAQTQAAVLRMNGCVRLLERQEDASDVFRLKADAVIVNQNNNPTGGRIIAGDVDYTSNRSELYRVSNKVE